MTPDQIEHVRGTWVLATVNPPAMTRLFYATLFRIDPSCKELFVGDLEMQGRKLASTLNFVVASLDDLDKLVPTAQELARKHLEFDVTQEQYASVGAALLETLRQLLGANFTSEHHEAWTAVYGVLAEVMIDAAYSE